MDLKFFLLLMIAFNTSEMALSYRWQNRHRQSGCRDYINMCSFFRHWCDSSTLGSWVQRNCKKTCGLCQPTPKPKPAVHCKDAEDFENICSAWKSANWCKKEDLLDSMKYYCEKTCGFCKTTVTAVKPKPPSQTCGRDKPSLAGKIVNGNDALPHQWEWQGGLYYKDFLDNPQFVCGGSLIESNIFLTAAHCVDKRTDKRKMMVRLGDHDRDKKENGEQDMKVTKIVIHEEWDRSTNQNDIAILQLEQNAKITDTVGTVCLAKEDIDVRSKPNCWITGWGKTGQFELTSTVLQEARLPILTNTDCKKRNRGITSSMVCGGFEKINGVVSGCMGDSGGPYVCKSGENWVLQGIVSWGSRRCDAQHLHTVFTRVSAYNDWIAAKTQTLR